MSYGFKEFSIEVLSKVNKPLGKMDIWNEGVKLGLDKKLESQGKTPWYSIGAQIYSEIKNKKSNSRFKQISNRPALFALDTQDFSIDTINNIINSVEIDGDNKQKYHYNERSLHPVLVKYLFSNSHFKCLTKTIMHEHSSKGKLHQDDWVHPDLIGIYFPYDDYEELTLNTLGILNEKSYKIFSFEVKIDIDRATLRKKYFQAVSNSTWANEGYLVAANIAEDDELLSEMSILNNAFGIGIIKLNIEIPEQSEILFYAKQKNEIDINMLDKLIYINPDVREIFQCLKDSESLSRIVNENKFDKILDDDKYKEHIATNIEKHK